MAEDRLWTSKGWRWIELANHLEHGLALPLALLDALHGGHAGTTTNTDVVVGILGYVAVYLTFTLINKRYSGHWVYPIFDELEVTIGPMGFWVLTVPIALAYLGLGFLGQYLSG